MTFRSYRLPPLNGVGAPLEFEWDPSTGALRGAGAGQVRLAAEEARRAGYTIGHPHPTPYAIRDPLRRPAELAVVLGNFWRLPPDLQAAYPRPPARNDVPPGSIA